MVVGENFDELVTLEFDGKNIAINYPHLRLKHVTLNLKTAIIYFIITCGAKTVHAFTQSSVVKG